MIFIKLFFPVIRKSDGNLMMWNGQFHVQRHPPPEAFGVLGEGENTIDAPPFAHTGGHDEHETEMKGVGHLIPGKYNQEPDSKALFWEDEIGGKHYHGIDGATHHLHNFLVKNGIKNPDAIGLIEKAIQDTNANHHEDNHLPSFGSPEWRRLAVGDYQKNDADRQHYIMHNGQKMLQTANTNWHKEKSPYGTFIDSLSIPFHKALKQNMQETYGFDDEDLSGRKTQFMNYPHIGRYLLSYATNPQTQQLFHNGDSYKPGHFFKDGKRVGGHSAPQSMLDTLRDAGITVDQAFQGINAHSIPHHLPDDFFKRKKQGMSSKDTAATRLAHQELLENYHPEYVGEALSSGKIKQSINPQEHPALSNTTYKGYKLSDYVSNPEALQMLLGELQNYGAFMKIYGRTSKQSHHNKLMNAATDLHTGGEVVDEDELLDLSGLRSHVGTQRGEKGRHHAAGNVFALMMASGRHPEMEEVAGNSNLRHTPIPPEILARHNVRLQDATPEEIQETRGAIEALSEYVADARGAQTRMPFPAELPTESVVPHQIKSGRYDGGVLASYIPYSGMQNPAIGDAQSRIASTTGETTVQPNEVSPINQTSIASPASQNAVMQPATSVNVARDTGMTPEQVSQARQATAGMTPEQLQRIAAAGGSRISSPEHIEAFRSSFSDPAQRFLTDYMKGVTDMSDAQDRIIKALEDIQMIDARKDDSIMKHITNKNMSIESELDISKISKKLGIAPQDVRVIHNAKGDWMRLSKSFGFSEKVVKIVKVSFGGIDDE